MSTRFEERSRFRLSVMWVLLLSGAACSCARDGASRTLLLVSVEVSEARSSMSTIDGDTVHSDERTISLAVIFVFIIYVRFIGIFYYPETPSDHSEPSYSAQTQSLPLLLAGVDFRLKIHIRFCRAYA